MEYPEAFEKLGIKTPNLEEYHPLYIIVSTALKWKDALTISKNTIERRKAKSDKMEAALVQIANYLQTEEGDRETTENEIGLPYCEVIEMAHDSMIMIARSVLDESKK